MPFFAITGGGGDTQKTGLTRSMTSLAQLGMENARLEERKKTSAFDQSMQTQENVRADGDFEMRQTLQQEELERSKLERTLTARQALERHQMFREKSAEGQGRILAQRELGGMTPEMERVAQAGSAFANSFPEGSPARAEAFAATGELLAEMRVGQIVDYEAVAANRRLGDLRRAFASDLTGIDENEQEIIDGHQKQLDAAIQTGLPEPIRNANADMLSSQNAIVNTKFRQKAWATTQLVSNGMIEKFATNAMNLATGVIEPESWARLMAAMRILEEHGVGGYEDDDYGAIRDVRQVLQGQNVKVRENPPGEDIRNIKNTPFGKDFDKNRIVEDAISNALSSGGIDAESVIAEIDAVEGATDEEKRAMAQAVLADPRMGEAKKAADKKKSDRKGSGQRNAKRMSEAEALMSRMQRPTGPF